MTSTIATHDLESLSLENWMRNPPAEKEWINGRLNSANATDFCLWGHCEYPKRFAWL